MTVPSADTVEYTWPRSSDATIAVEPEDDREMALIGALEVAPGHFNGTDAVVAPGAVSVLVSREPGRATVSAVSSRAIAWPSGRETTACQLPVDSSFHSPIPPFTQSARTSNVGASAPAAVLADAWTPEERSVARHAAALERIDALDAGGELGATVGEPFEQAPTISAAPTMLRTVLLLNGRRR